MLHAIVCEVNYATRSGEIVVKKLLCDTNTPRVHSEFLFPHRSFIVNAFFVSCITTDKIYLRANENTVPIARGKANGIKAAYDEYFRSYNRETNRTPE